MEEPDSNWSIHPSGHHDITQGILFTPVKLESGISLHGVKVLFAWLCSVIYVCHNYIIQAAKRSP